MIIRHNAYHRLDYHIVCVTKFRERTLTRQVMQRIEENCLKKAEELGFLFHIANGYLDHIHILISIKPSQKLSEIIRHIKGYSSRQIKGLKWQRGYGAFTVDKRSFSTVFSYIQKQVEHHSKTPQ